MRRNPGAAENEAEDVLGFLNNAMKDLADDDGQDKHLHDEQLRVPVLRGAQHILRHVLREALFVLPSRVT